MAGSSPTLTTRYRTALVTGASSGIGAAVAKALLKEGMTVYGTARRPTGTLPGLHEIAFEGRYPGSLTTFLEENSDLLRSIDILVNNAGAATFGDLLAGEEGSASEAVHLLLSAPMALCRAVLPGMRQRGSGAVVNVSSLASLFPLPYLAAYSAGKAGVSSFTQSQMLTEDHPGVIWIDLQLGDFRTAFNRAMRPEGPLAPEAAVVWERMEAHLAGGPDPDQAARDLLRHLRRGRSAVVRSGGFFQTTMAPLGVRLLPRKWLLAAIGRYYGLRR